MTDNNQTPPTTIPTPTTPTEAREQVVENASLEEKVKVAGECIANNKSFIMKCLTSLPGPILVLVKGFVNVLLIPLHLLASLPFNNIYGALKDFVGDGSVESTSTTPPTISSDNCGTGDNVQS